MKQEKHCIENLITVVKGIILSNQEIGTPTKGKLLFVSSTYNSSLSSLIHLETIAELLKSLSSFSDFVQTNINLQV